MDSQFKGRVSYCTAFGKHTNISIGVGMCGWFSDKRGSSHYTFRKQGCMPITIPKHEPIKKAYVEMVRQIVESEAKNDENAE